MSKQSFIDAIFLMLSLLLIAPVSAMGSVVDVKSTPNVIDFQRYTNSQISWQVTQATELSVLVVDLDGVVVKSLMERTSTKAGTYNVKWNGYGDQGNQCPDGVYLPIIISHAGSETSIVYNPSENPWGETVQPKDLYYDSKLKMVHYRLEKPALCRIRAGEYEGGPLYRTLLNWQYRNPGTHDEPWDGMDESEVVAITKKLKHYIVVDAFTLPENAIIVTSGNGEGKRASSGSAILKINPPHGRNVNTHALHSRPNCGDFPISVNLMKQAGVKTDVLSGFARLQVSASTGISANLLTNKKIELYLFGDGHFLFEVLPEKLPAEVKLDTHQLENGKHVLTVNVRTGEDHIGACSKEILISNE